MNRNKIPLGILKLIIVNIIFIYTFKKTITIYYWVVLKVVLVLEIDFYQKILSINYQKIDSDMYRLTQRFPTFIGLRPIFQKKKKKKHLVMNRIYEGVNQYRIWVTCINYQLSYPMFYHTKDTLSTNNNWSSQCVYVL